LRAVVIRPASVGGWIGVAVLTFAIATATHSVTDGGSVVRTKADRATAVVADVAQAPPAGRPAHRLEVVGIPALRLPPHVRRQPPRPARAMPAATATPVPVPVAATAVPAPASVAPSRPPAVAPPARSPGPAPTPGPSFDSSG
jgi:hypothetical protein